MSEASTANLSHWAAIPFAYLTTTGRRSGQAHRIEIWFAIENDAIFLMAGGRDRSDWVRNLQANPSATIELGTDRFTGVATVLTESDPDDGAARRLLVGKYRSANDDLAEWGRTSLAVVIRNLQPVA